MCKQVLAGVLVSAAAVANCGCTQENSVVGRWKSARTTVYFREDGQLFYRSASGEKYRGPYYVDVSTDPLTVQSKMVKTDGSKSREIKLAIEFLTAKRMRITDMVGSDSRAMLFERVEPTDAKADEAE